jgi:hypothetical protein
LAAAPPAADYGELTAEVAEILANCCQGTPTKTPALLLERLCELAGKPTAGGVMVPWLVQRLTEALSVSATECHGAVKTGAMRYTACISPSLALLGCYGPRVSMIWVAQSVLPSVMAHHGRIHACSSLTGALFDGMMAAVTLIMELVMAGSKEFRTEIKLQCTDALQRARAWEKEDPDYGGKPSKMVRKKSEELLGLLLGY